MVGVIACGGKSTRLFPCTTILSKQLLPLFDKPIIYYPISMLLKVGIKDIAIVINKENLQNYQSQLGDGSQFGASIKYIVDDVQKGIVSALLKTEEMYKGQKVCYILGDNFFYGKEFDKKLEQATKLDSGAYCFGYPVKNPKAFGVANFDKNGNIIEIEEKPQHPKSNQAVTGIYVYDENVYDIAKQVKPSKRNEYEITDLNNIYLKQKKLNLIKLSKKNYWLDAGNCEALYKATKFVRKQIKKTKQQIACLDEIAYQKGFISKDQLKSNYEKLKQTSYGKYLEKYL